MYSLITEREYPDLLCHDFTFSDLYVEIYLVFWSKMVKCLSFTVIYGNRYSYNSGTVMPCNRDCPLSNECKYK